MAEKEDLANTPAERAAKARLATVVGHLASDAGSQDEKALFAAAEEITVGETGHIVIIGAGLVGALCAVVLLRKGFKVHVYERYEDIRGIPSVGRSINLSVTSRGLRAVRSLGDALAEEVLSIATKVMGRIIHLKEDAEVMFQRYGKDDTECNFSISRVELNKLLINAAAREGAEFHFNHGMSDTSDFTCKAPIGCMLHFTVGTPGTKQSRVRVRCGCPVIACDGGGSRVRYALQSAGLTEFTETMMEKGYKEVLFPKPEGEGFGAKGTGGGEACDGRLGLHIWPRGDHFLMALANVDGSFTGTFYMDKEGEESFASLSNTPEGKARCKKFCEEHYPEAIPLVGGVDALVNQITENPLGILGTVITETWAVGGRVVLIGDACHAMVPFFGQGCNCGFEDTLWLSRLLDEHCCNDGRVSFAKCTGENFAKVFKALETERKPNAKAICQMALENYAEMGAKSADIKFRAQKKLENRIENAFSLKFRSRYAMVCYGGDGNVSYANAQKLGVVQDRILGKLCEDMAGLDTDEVVQAKVESMELNRALQLIEEELLPVQRELGIDLSTVKH